MDLSEAIRGLTQRECKNADRGCRRRARSGRLDAQPAGRGNARFFAPAHVNEWSAFLIRAPLESRIRLWRSTLTEEDARRSDFACLPAEVRRGWVPAASIQELASNLAGATSIRKIGFQTAPWPADRALWDVRGIGKAEATRAAANSLIARQCLYP